MGKNGWIRKKNGERLTHLEFRKLRGRLFEGWSANYRAADVPRAKYPKKR